MRIPELDEKPENFKKCCNCKYFYDLHFSYDGYHNVCSKEICYLCYGDFCTHKKVGNVKKKKKRGGWNE